MFSLKKHVSFLHQSYESLLSWSLCHTNRLEAQLFWAFYFPFCVQMLEDVSLVHALHCCAPPTLPGQKLKSLMIYRRCLSSMLVPNLMWAKGHIFYQDSHITPLNKKCRRKYTVRSHWCEEPRFPNLKNAISNQTIKKRNNILKALQLAKTHALKLNCAQRGNVSLTFFFGGAAYGKQDDWMSW